MSDDGQEHRQADLPQVETGCLVEGEWVAAGQAFGVTDKFSDEVVTHVSEATAELVARGVAAGARTVSEPLAPADRASVLDNCARLVAQRRADFVALMVIEAGFTRTDAENEVDRAVSTLRISAGEATRIVGETVAFGATPGQHSRIGFTVRSPIGVVCAITPFNSPLNVVAHKVGPAIAAGNSVVLKPSPLAPLCAALLCELLLEAGTPPGGLALLHGKGSTVGEWLLAEPGVGFYAFTGSTAVGRAIAAGAGLRRTQLELGSIASSIVAGTADLDRAVAKVSNAAFRKAGQVCTSTQRLYVHQSVEEDFLDRLGRAVADLPAGDPRDPATKVGPMISPHAVDRIDSWVQQAVDAGASVLYGGDRTATVYQPTVLVDVDPTTKVVTEELFAPVVCVMRFDRIEDAFAGANDTPFGLSCGVFTRDTDEVTQAISRLRFGSVHINEASSARGDEMPFGGLKNSGHGHEGPRYAVREMTEERLITLNP